MSNVLNWIIPTLIYGFMGFYLFVKHRNSIVISNRRPGIVLIEQVTVFIWVILCILTFDKQIASEFTCEYSESTITFLCIVSIILAIARLSYVYRYLMKTEHVMRYGLGNICSLFWNHNNVLKTKQVIIGTLFLGLVSVINVVGYHSANNIWGYGYPLCNTYIGETYFAEYLNFLLGFILLMFAFQLIRYKIKDQIGMAMELISYTLSLALVIVIYLGMFGAFDHRMICIEGLVSMFYGLYFPVFIHYRHVSFSSSIEKQGKVSLTDIRIAVLCKKFYCQENSQFLDRYKDYKNKEVSYEAIIRTFIEEGSIYELNITNDTRVNVLQSTPETVDIALSVVYDEIALLIRQNILPYIDNPNGTV